MLMRGRLLRDVKPGRSRCSTPLSNLTINMTYASRYKQTTFKKVRDNKGIDAAGGVLDSKETWPLPTLRCQLLQSRTRCTNGAPKRVVGVLFLLVASTAVRPRAGTHSECLIRTLGVKIRRLVTVLQLLL
jgi:hypothetical protein